MPYAVAIQNDVLSGFRSFCKSNSISAHQLIYFSQSDSDAATQIINLQGAIDSQPNINFIKIEGSSIVEEYVILKELANQIKSNSMQYVIIIKDFDPLKYSLEQSPISIQDLNNIFIKVKVLVVYILNSLSPSEQHAYYNRITNQIVKIYDQASLSSWNLITNQIKISDPDYLIANQAAAMKALQAYQTSTTTGPTAAQVIQYINSAPFATAFATDGGTSANLVALLADINKLSSITTPTTVSAIQQSIASMQPGTYTKSDIAAAAAAIQAYIILQTTTTQTVVKPSVVISAAIQAPGISQSFVDAVQAIDLKIPVAQIVQKIQDISNQIAPSDQIYGLTKLLLQSRGIKSYIFDGKNESSLFDQISQLDDCSPFMLLIENYNLTSVFLNKILLSRALTTLSGRAYGNYDNTMSCQFVLITPQNQSYLLYKTIPTITHPAFRPDDEPCPNNAWSSSRIQQNPDCDSEQTAPRPPFTPPNLKFNSDCYEKRYCNDSPSIVGSIKSWCGERYRNCCDGIANLSTTTKIIIVSGIVVVPSWILAIKLTFFS